MKTRIAYSHSRHEAYSSDLFSSRFACRRSLHERCSFLLSLSLACNMACYSSCPIATTLSTYSSAGSSWEEKSGRIDRSFFFSSFESKRHSLSLYPNAVPHIDHILCSSSLCSIPFLRMDYSPSSFNDLHSHQVRVHSKSSSSSPAIAIVSERAS